MAPIHVLQARSIILFYQLIHLRQFRCRKRNYYVECPSVRQPEIVKMNMLSVLILACINFITNYNLGKFM